MARPLINVSISSGIQGWDAAVNDNFEIFTEGPWPVYEKAVGNESNLTATFPPGSFDRCVLFVNHSTLGWTPYFSNGSTWEIIPAQAASQADSVAVVLATLVSDFNALLAKLRASGAMAP
jgi:hypothetical protein